MKDMKIPKPKAKARSGGLKAAKFPAAKPKKFGYASGGMVRGCGAAKKGRGFGGSY